MKIAVIALSHWLDLEWLGVSRSIQTISLASMLSLVPRTVCCVSLPGDHPLS